MLDFAVSVRLTVESDGGRGVVCRHYPCNTTLTDRGCEVFTVQDFEKQVRDLEGFDIRIRHERDARDVRGDKEFTVSYSYVRAAKSDWSVAKFLQVRITPFIGGYSVEVVDPAGRRVNGRTKLRNLRIMYL